MSGSLSVSGGVKRGGTSKDDTMTNYGRCHDLCRARSLLSLHQMNWSPWRRLPVRALFWIFFSHLLSGLRYTRVLVPAVSHVAFNNASPAHHQGYSHALAPSSYLLCTLFGKTVSAIVRATRSQLCACSKTHGASQLPLSPSTNAGTRRV